MSFNMLDRQRELLVYRLRLFMSSFFERTFIYYVFSIHFELNAIWKQTLFC